MIAHTYKPKRKKNGKVRIARTYRGRYRLDGDFKISDVALKTNDKQVAEKRLQEIISQAQKERAGLIPSRVQRVAAQRSLLKHLDDWIKDLEALQRSPVYVRLVQARNVRLFEDCNWTFVRDVNANDFTAWRASVNKLSPKTLNEYLNALNALLNWMVKLGRIEANPIAKITKIDLRGKQQRRRALTDDELQRLLHVSGTRRLLYMTACYTGLRQNELRLLCWGDLNLEGEKPFIKARASTTKNGKDAVLPLHPQLAALLEIERPITASEGTLVFSMDSKPDRAFNRDLKLAKIDRIDGLNRKVDFHALRYTFCTMLARQGTSQRMAQELMRHSDPHLTAQIYTDVSQLPTFDAVSALPWQQSSDTHIDTQKMTQLVNQWRKLSGPIST